MEEALRSVRLAVVSFQRFDPARQLPDRATADEARALVEACGVVPDKSRVAQLGEIAGKHRPQDVELRDDSYEAAVASEDGQCRHLSFEEPGDCLGEGGVLPHRRMNEREVAEIGHQSWKRRR
jgi:hypothetical protein